MTPTVTTTYQLNLSRSDARHLLDVARSSPTMALPRELLNALSAATA